MCLLTKVQLKLLLLFVLLSSQKLYCVFLQTKHCFLSTPTNVSLRMFSFNPRPFFWHLKSSSKLVRNEKFCKRNQISIKCRRGGGGFVDKSSVETSSSFCPFNCPKIVLRFLTDETLLFKYTN